MCIVTAKLLVYHLVGLNNNTILHRDVKRVITQQRGACTGFLKGGGGSNLLGLHAKG